MEVTMKYYRENSKSIKLNQDGELASCSITQKVGAYISASTLDLFLSPHSLTQMCLAFPEQIHPGNIITYIATLLLCQKCDM